MAANDDVIHRHRDRRHRTGHHRAAGRRRKTHRKTEMLFSSFLFFLHSSLIGAAENCSESDSPSADGGGRTLFKIGVLYTVREGQRTRPAYYLGAIPYAIEKINSDLLCDEPFRLGFWAEDTMGDVKRCLRTMTIKRNDTIAFVGPEKQCYVEAYFAAAWNKPLITYVSIYRPLRERPEPHSPPSGCLRSGHG